MQTASSQQPPSLIVFIFDRTLPYVAPLSPPRSHDPDDLDTARQHAVFGCSTFVFFFKLLRCPRNLGNRYYNTSVPTPTFWHQLSFHIQSISKHSSRLTLPCPIYKFKKIRHTHKTKRSWKPPPRPQWPRPASPGRRPESIMNASASPTS